MAEFPTVLAYCQKLKMVADQLSNVSAPVSNHRLVLRLIAGLPPSYRSLVSQIQHKDPLSLFSTACSMLRLEETTMADSAALEANAAMAAVDDVAPNENYHNNNAHNNNNNARNHRNN